MVKFMGMDKSMVHVRFMVMFLFKFMVIFSVKFKFMVRFMVRVMVMEWVRFKKCLRRIIWLFSGIRRINNRRAEMQNRPSPIISKCDPKSG